jgi:hypothetical protein
LFDQIIRRVRAPAVSVVPRSPTNPDAGCKEGDGMKGRAREHLNASLVLTILVAAFAFILLFAGSALAGEGQGNGVGLEKKEAETAEEAEAEAPDAPDVTEEEVDVDQGGTEEEEDSAEEADAVEDTVEVEEAELDDVGGEAVEKASSSTADSVSTQSANDPDDGNGQPTHGCAQADENDGDVYDSTCDGSPSGNGNGNGNATGKPCAGCVGAADNKNPPGQLPGPEDGNNGYECDGNNGIGKTNPAHTGCEAAPVAPPPEAPPIAPPPPPKQPPPKPEAPQPPIKEVPPVIAPEVEGKLISPPIDVTPPTRPGVNPLPVTGVRLELWLLIGFALMAAGLYLLRRGRRLEHAGA